MGTNGTGKSTITKLITGELDLFEGKRYINKNVHYHYLPQGLNGFFRESTLLDNFTSLELHQTAVRQHLGGVLIQGDKVTEPIKNFSLGELMRAAIIKCILEKAEFLLLDEPTSHLDIESVEILEQLLQNFPG